METYRKLAISKPQDLIFGKSLHPVTTRRGLVIGNGDVYPELNFTLPPMSINDSTFPQIRGMYRDLIDDACRRAVELECEGFVAELETLIEMTTNPRYAIELTRVLNEVMDTYHARHGLKTAVRVTPNDTREMVRPPIMRGGRLLDTMLETFEGCAAEGGELLSIESTGGKEIHDDALLSCDIGNVLFALSIMGCRDMEFLWKEIVSIAAAHNTVAAGDTACGFGNTAMVLAEKKMIPRSFAAVVRAMTAVRSLVAYEQGAVGPGKDCGYENIYLKAITGYPMSMEGKVAACAHLSPLGNVAAATCDLWSNESIQNIKLLGGMAPTVCLEQLVYDCRLMNEATATGQGLVLQKLMATSDQRHDPQAHVLTPENAIAIARSIVSAPNHYEATKAAGLTAIALIKQGLASGATKVPEMELPYLDIMESTLCGMPKDEDVFVNQYLALVDKSKFTARDYKLAA